MRLLAALVFVLIVGGITTSHPAEAAPVVDQYGGCTERLSTAGLNQAGLVVRFDDGSTRTYCVEFDEETITGIELLQRSGLPIVTSAQGLGAAVCSIDGQGCSDPGSCFCKCQGGTCEYWVYYGNEAGAWTFSGQGASRRIIHNGDADAWVWGGPGAAPLLPSPACDSPTPSPTVLPSPTVAPSMTPQSSSTPQPSVTSLPVENSPTASTSPIAGATGSVALPSPPTQSVAPTGAPPTSVVLSEVRTPSLRTSTAVPATRSALSASPTVTRSATTIPRTPTGTIRVSDVEGERNLAGQQSGGDWQWHSLVTFGGIAIALLGLGAVVLWRRRAGV